MMLLKERITLMDQLGHYFLENKEEWQEIKQKAFQHNNWFTPEYIQIAVDHIAHHFLTKEKIEEWIKDYPQFEKENPSPIVGIVMAGNIPLVGFHDFLSVFISGCKSKIKLSSKDTVLWEHIFKLLNNWNPAFSEQMELSEILKNCDAYIATGSNNTAKHFEYYFAKFPHIIRKNRTSVAVLNGGESEEDLKSLSTDIGQYFGLGCRNVSKIYVPENYNFEHLIPALNSYQAHIDFQKYKNNYDYQLALLLLNKVPYMSSEQLLLVPSESDFAPISVLNYEFYNDEQLLLEKLSKNDDLQCIIGNSEQAIGFGKAQNPRLTDYADGVNTLNFLKKLKE